MAMTAAYGDENADVNVQSSDAGDLIAPAKKGSKLAAALAGDEQQPAVTPKLRLEPSLQAWAASRPQSIGVFHNVGASERCVGAELSVDSRYSRRSSHRSSGASSRRSLSTEELDEIRLEQKRQELRDLMRRNERSCREAIHGHQASGTPAGMRSLEVTVPQEFSLSTPRDFSTSVRGRHPDATLGKEGEGESFLPADWSQGLRKASAAAAARSKSRNRGTWRPQLTVPSAPLLSTEHRARSRSCSSSRRSTPASTPERSSTPRCSSARGRPLPAREQAAVEFHTLRHELARRHEVCPSPLRRRSVSASPARSFRSARGHATPSPAPSSCSDMSMASVDSRISQLSRPRSLSRRRGLPNYSTEELERQRAEEGRRSIHERVRSNSRGLPRVLAPPDPLKASTCPLTMPDEHELRVERRARSRSASVHSSTASAPAEVSVTMLERLPQRERSAVARHLERNAMAHIMERADRGAPVSQLSCEGVPASARGSQEAREAWVRQARTPEERAHRARAAAQAARAEVDRSERSRLCIFKRGAGAGAGAGGASAGAPELAAEQDSAAREAEEAAAEELPAASAGEGAGDADADAPH